MPTAAPRLYNDRRWRDARAAFLVEHPLCVYCEKAGRLRGATVVDHVIPHKGDAEVFWNRDGWQPLCKACHDSIKQKEERGRVVGCDAAGNPIDPGQHWI